MTDLRIIPWIRDHGEGEAVTLARTLIYAEAGRLGLPLGEFSMSGRVKAKDQVSTVVHTFLMGLNRCIRSDVDCGR
jgi:hypothetical protein